jgi:hypothetical protein
MNLWFGLVAIFVSASCVNAYHTIRDLQPRDATVLKTWTVGGATSTISHVSNGNGTQKSNGNDIQKRGCKNCISKCGPRSGWIPLTWGDDKDHMGFNEAISQFCNSRLRDAKGNPIILQKNWVFSTIVRNVIEGDEDTPRVMLTSKSIGRIDCKLYWCFNDGGESGTDRFLCSQGPKSWRR